MDELLSIYSCARIMILAKMYGSLTFGSFKHASLCARLRRSDMKKKKRCIT